MRGEGGRQGGWMRKSIENRGFEVEVVFRVCIGCMVVE
jgi:hypothetical protein